MKNIEILFFLLFSCALARYIQVPPVSGEDTLWLRLNEYKNQQVVFNRFGQLNKIIKKQVAEVVGGKQTDFEVCFQQDPEINFWEDEVYLIDESLPPREKIVYEFQQIQYSRNLIDIAKLKDKIIYMLEDGRISVAEISKGNGEAVNIKHVTRFQSAQQKVKEGNFIVVDQAQSSFVVFLNANQSAIYSSADKKFTQFNGYEKMKQYESAVYMDRNYIAVAYGQQGVAIYSVHPDKLVLVANITQFPTATFNIKDVAYDPDRKILFILDYLTGVIPKKISYTAESIKISPTSSLINGSLCDLMHFDQQNDELYLNCRELKKYWLNNWPVVTQKSLPKQEIKVREIVSSKYFTLFVGRNIFEVIKDDRKVALYRDKLLDKILLFDDSFISANEEAIIIGGFNLKSPVIACQTSDSAQIGSHRVIYKAVAECNTDYFEKIGFKSGSLSEEDKCIYTVYRDLIVWQPAVFKETPFLIAGIFLTFLGLAILGWWLFSWCSLRKFRSNVDNYKMLDEEMKESSTPKQESQSSDIENDASRGTGEKLTQKEDKEEAIHDIE